METLETKVEPAEENVLRGTPPHGTLREAYEVFDTSRSKSYRSREVIGIFWKEDDAKKLGPDLP